MVHRSTWIVLAVFVILLGSAWWFQHSKGNNKQASSTPTPAELPLFSIQESQLKNLSIENKVGKQVSLAQDSPGLWSITQPEIEATDTDTNTIKSAIVQFLTATILSTPDPAPARTDVGLASPAFTLTLKLDSGKQMVLLVGDSTPTNSGYYIVVDQDPVRVVPKYAFDTLTGWLDILPIKSVTPGSETPTTGEIVPPTLTPAQTSTVPAPTSTLTPQLSEMPALTPTVQISATETITP